MLWLSGVRNLRGCCHVTEEHASSPCTGSIRVGQAGKVVVYADMHCHIMAGTKLARYHALTSASLDCQLHKALSPGQVHLLPLRVLRQEDACMHLQDSAYDFAHDHTL